jgi:probable O-glycosylation ligase (exosortase A-associated)
VPLNSFIPLSLFVVCLFAKGLRPIDEIFRDPMSKWIFIYFGLILLSMTHAEVTWYAYQVSLMVLGYVFLFFIIVRIVTSKARLLGVFATLLVAHLFLLVMNPEVVLNSEVRNYIKGGTFLGDGNDFSLSICILVPMGLELARAAQSRLKRFLWWIAVSVLIVALINTQSRGAMLGIAAVGGYLWLASPRKARTLLIGLMVVGAILVYAPDVYFQRMGTIANYQDEGSALGRIAAWKAALRMLSDNPLLGVGAGHFPIAFGTTYRPAGEGSMPWLTAHSMYFLVIGELGLPGIVSLLALVFGNVRLSSRLRRELIVLGTNSPSPHWRDSADTLNLLNASMIGLMVAGAFLSVAYYPHVFILTALTVSFRRVVAAGGSVVAEANPGGRARLYRHRAVSRPAR